MLTHHHTPTTVTETINTGNPKTLNQTLHDNDSCTANTQTQRLTKKKKTNVDIKTIMFEKKTTLLSLRNQHWKTVKFETEKLNDLLTNIPISEITEFNDLIYAGAKSVYKKNRSPLEDHRQKVKTQVGTQT